MSEDADVARLMALVAAELDDNGFLKTGSIRRGARVIIDQAERIATLEAELAQYRKPPTGPGCPSCGGDVDRLSTGRPRVYCSDLCRKRHARRKGGNETVQR